MNATPQPPWPTLQLLRSILSCASSTLTSGRCSCNGTSKSFCPRARMTARISSKAWWPRWEMTPQSSLSCRYISDYLFILDSTIAIVTVSKLDSGFTARVASGLKRRRSGAGAERPRHSRAARAARRLLLTLCVVVEAVLASACSLTDQQETTTMDAIIETLGLALMSNIPTVAQVTSHSFSLACKSKRTISSVLLLFVIVECMTPGLLSRSLVKCMYF